MPASSQASLWVLQQHWQITSILLPLFESFMPLDQLIASFAELLPFIHTKLDVVLFNAFPFNLLKGLVIGGVTMLIYKKLTPCVERLMNHDTK